MRLGVVILAAGASTRMGRPKLLLPWGHTTVLGHLLEQWNGAGAAQVAVVVAADDEAIAAELDRLGLRETGRISNPHRERGMFNSIQCSARWTGWQNDLTHVAMTLGDQPHLRAETLRGLAELARNNPASICQPTWQGRPKHPVIFPRRAFHELAGTDAATLREFLGQRPAEQAYFESGDAGLELDIDTPADYERAHQMAFGSLPT